VDELAVMLLDVLSGFDEIKICSAYTIDGKRVEHFPSHVDDLKKAVPVYETVPGWQEELSAIRRYDDLPEGARRYIAKIGALLGRPVSIVSVGPDRSQTILCPAAADEKPWPRHQHPVRANA
jgi:adenylosuccinate synthase